MTLQYVATALGIPMVDRSDLPITSKVNIAMLIWQRNRMTDLFTDLENQVTLTPVTQEAWDGLLSFIDFFVDEATPPGESLPPPYRPWHPPFGGGPTTTRECWIDYVDANGGLAMSHKLWSEYSDYCKEAGVDPLIKET
jgi:hypothetical protein